MQMSRGCHRFWTCYKTITVTFCSVLARCRIPCACHAKAHLNPQKWSMHVVLLTCWLGNVLRATTACTFSTSQLPEVARRWCVLYVLISKRASRHNGIHSFDSQLPKAAQTWSALHILTSKCASRHNGVQLFISHLARWLRAHRFSEPTFRPSGATNHWKNIAFRDSSYLFARLHLLSSDSFSSLIFSLLLFSSLTLPTSLLFHVSVGSVWLLNFLCWLYMEGRIPQRFMQNWHAELLQFCVSPPWWRVEVP